MAFSTTLTLTSSRRLLPALLLLLLAAVPLYGAKLEKRQGNNAIVGHMNVELPYVDVRRCMMVQSMKDFPPNQEQLDNLLGTTQSSFWKSPTSSDKRIYTDGQVLNDIDNVEDLCEVCDVAVRTNKYSGLQYNEWSLKRGLCKYLRGKSGGSRKVNNAKASYNSFEQATSCSNAYSNNLATGNYCALSRGMYSLLFCGAKVKIQTETQEATCTVVDRCETCDTKDLVVTASVYEQLLQDKSTNQQYMPVSWSISLP